MVILLIVASIVSAFTGDKVECFIIIAIVIINAIMSIIQEGKAEDSVEALQKMSSPEASVIRDGKKIKVKAEELVVGDVVVIETGDIVPADMGEKLARSIAGSNLLQFFHFSDDYSMIELKAYDELVGRSLKEIDFRKKYKMMVIAYKRDGELIINPEANWKIEKDDTLVLLGDSDHADKLQKEVDKYK